MKHVVIATFEGNADAIFSGIKEFPTEKIVLLVPLEFLADAEKFRAMKRQITKKAIKIIT